MKHLAHKKLLVGLGLGLGAILLSGCTANFCSEHDQAAMAYPYDQGVTVYCTKDEYDTWVKANPEAYQREKTWSDEAEALGMPRIEGLALEGNALVYKYVPISPKQTVTKESDGSETTTYDWNVITYDAVKYDGSVLQTVLKNASTTGYYTPSVYYFGLLDDFVLKASIATAFGKTGYAASSDYALYYNDAADSSFKDFVGSLTAHDASTGWTISAYDRADTNGSKFYDYSTCTIMKNDDDHKTNMIETLSAYDGNNKGSVLHFGGKMKYAGPLGESGKEESRKLWSFYDSWNQEIKEMAAKGHSKLDLYSVASTDFIAAYKSAMVSKVNTIRSCIATRDDYFGHYGSNGDWRVAIQKKDWGYAWSKGFLEGLLVFPVSWLVDTFAYGMDPALTGFGQVLALVFVTLIVRGLLLLVSFRSTLSQQKMQALQPELAKIQAKYPNSNTNQAEKQRLSQEQMSLYKRNKINPFGQIIIMIVQFPVFICVWSGLQGSAAMSTGSFLNMRLSDTIQSIIFNVQADGWAANATGWWTALILFLLMAGTQIFSMLLPRLFQRAAAKKVAKLGKNPAQDSQNKTMKWVSIAMIGFTIVMGFMLPSAMGIYWLITGLISMVQTLITQLVLANSRKKVK